MVKFGKTLENQLVPEWRSAYVDYKQLKRDIQDVKNSLLDAHRESTASRYLASKIPSVPPTLKGGSSPLAHEIPRNAHGTKNLTRKLTRQLSHGVREMHDNFADTVRTVKRATGRGAAGLARSVPISRKYRHSAPTVKVNKVRGEDEQLDIFITELIGKYGITASPSRVFFSRLDGELNKVNGFYVKKEKEFTERFEDLKKQVAALEEIRLILRQRQQQPDKNVLTEVSSSDDKVMKASDESVHKAESIKSGLSEVTIRSNTEEHVIDPSQNQLSISRLESKISSVSVLESVIDIDDNPPCLSEKCETEISHLRLNIPIETPVPMIKALTASLWEDLSRPTSLKEQGSLSDDEAQSGVSRKEVAAAERMIRTAFVEFYRGLTLLKNYSSLNVVAFGKIIKKFDKMSVLVEKVETMFAKAFMNDDISRARLKLRPRQKKASHSVSFFFRHDLLYSLFTGVSLAFLAVFFVLLERMLSDYITPYSESNSLAPAVHTPENIYLKTIFPMFGLSALISIHLFMYGFNVYFWRKWRINYSFMFNFKQGTELQHREVLMIASILMTILLAAVVGHLALHSISDSPYVDFIPLGVFLLLVALLFLPANVFYYSARVSLLTSFIHLALAPFYKVTLADFFLGDQMTSQVPALRNFQYLACFYAGKFFMRSDSDGCLLNKTFKALVYLVSLLPYWWRFLQCIRRYVEEHQTSELPNAFKYLSAMIAVIMRIEHTRNRSFLFTLLFILASVLATAFQIYWDLWRDWGLMRRESSNKWLRDELIMPKHKIFYVMCMVVNVTLRFAWLQSITRWRFGLADFQVADFVFAVLEVTRRGIWNFFRLENEHLNNVGKFRATKSLPLPFEESAKDSNK